MLSFYEKSSGMLPLFDLVKLHESRTELIITLPMGFNPQIVTLESTGGHVQILDSGENIYAKTYTGAILLSTPQDVNIKAATELGTIEVGGTESGQKTSGGLEYYNNTQSDRTVELQSSRGNIEISR
jgi:hypothetical protein